MHSSQQTINKELSTEAIRTDTNEWMNESAVI